MMNPEIKKQWVDALRSGKYIQGKHALRTSREDGDRFCCLGVLCDIHEKTGTGEWEEAEPDGIALIKLKRYNGESALPPASVVSWLGIQQNDLYTLVRANDRGAPFTKIAELIEEFE